MMGKCTVIFLTADVYLYLLILASVYGWVSRLQRSQQTSWKVVCQHFTPHFPFLVHRKRGIVLDPCSHTRLRNPGNTGRITSVTAAFQGVSLLQEAASETWASVSSQQWTCSPFIMAYLSEKLWLGLARPSPAPDLCFRRTNLQTAALLGGKVLWLQSQGEERCSRPSFIFFLPPPKAPCVPRPCVTVCTCWAVEPRVD